MNWIRAIAVVALGAAICVTPLQAKIYKFVLPDGTVVYSDTPPEKGAREVELPPLQTFTPPPLPPSSPALTVDEPAADYESFEVASPANDEAIRDNGGSVKVGLKIAPALRSGHEVEIFVDGTSVGRGRGSSATLTDVDRGSHSVYATIVDGEGKEVARTPSITFHLQRVHIRRKQPRAGG